MDETPLDNSIRLFNEYRAGMRSTTHEEMSRINALPGYDEAWRSAQKFADKDGALDLQVAMPDLYPQIEEITGSYRGTFADLEVQWHEIVAVVKELETSDVENLLRYAETLKWNDRSSLLGIIARSQNPNAYDYLLHRLDAPKDELDPRSPMSFFERIFAKVAPWMRETQAKSRVMGRALNLSHAISCLGSFGDPRAIPAIQPFREDSHELVRKKANWALDRLEAAV